MLDILSDIQRYCPGAVFLNYTNPMAMLCRAAGAQADGENWSGLALAWAKETGLTDGLEFTATDLCPRSDVVYCIWKQMN